MVLPIVKDFLLQLTLIATLIFTFQIFFSEKTAVTPRAKVSFIVLNGLAVLLCILFPAEVSPDVRIDIRAVPLLLGTLYGGWRAGLILSVLILLIRLGFGMDSGFYTTVMSLALSVPVMVWGHRFFKAADKRRKILLSLFEKRLRLQTAGLPDDFGKRAGARPSLPQ